MDHCLYPSENHFCLKLSMLMQMLYLDDWDLIDQDHSSSLSGVTEALEASTVRLPVSGGARVCARAFLS